MVPMASKISTPQVIITEQPISKPIRYRYKCEGRSAGTIPGEFSTEKNKTYPSIKIVGYQGNARVIVSCVTKEQPYRPHPHSLVGREGCNNGICTMDIPGTTLSITFSNLGIQCARRKDIDQVLHVRQTVTKIDPFNTGFEHRHNSTLLDMNVVRLCFQVFIENASGECIIPLTPVVSEPVYDIKAMGNLIICRLSECVSPVDGGKKDIYLLCKKISKENIKVRFYEGDEDNPTWEGFPSFEPSQVHEQTAIWFRAPPYKSLDILTPVKVFIQLLRPSDGAKSESRPFQFLPTDAEPGMLKRKRQKFGNDPRRHILLELQDQLHTGTTSYYNIPPAPEFTNIDLTSAQQTPNGNEFKYPPFQENAFLNILKSGDKMNSIEDNYNIPSCVQNIDTPLSPYQNFILTGSSTPNTFSPLYQNISPPIFDNLQYPIPGSFTKALNNKIGTPPGSNPTETNYDLCQITREKVNNAIRAKCISKLNTQQPTTNVSNILEYQNQIELRNTSQSNITINTNGMTLQGEVQNNLGMSLIQTNGASSLLDVDFEQLENLLVPAEEDNYNALNFPMNAMTISDVSCSLSSLLNMDSVQLQPSMGSDQLDNLLAII